MAVTPPGIWGIDLGQCGLKAIRLENIDGEITATAFDYIEHPKILSQPDAAAKGKPPLKPVPLNLNYKKVSQTGFGIPFCIIFRPDKLALADGKRYWVEITGLEKKDGAAATLRYMVFFVNQD